MEHNQPKTLEELYAWNDVELFDRQDDPKEMKNLAEQSSKNRELIFSMNQKLQKQIQTEIGEDNGHELPNIPGIDWTAASIDL